MLRLYFIVLLFVSGLPSFSQSADSQKLETQCGLLLFIGKGNVWSTLFVQTSQLAPNAFMRSDTLRVKMLGIPGCDAGNTFSYRYHLRSKMSFDSISCIGVIENDSGMYIEDSCQLEYQTGCISFVKSKAYKLQKRYEKMIIQNKKVILEAEDYISIEDFEYATPRMSDQ